jgi:hypothetical protein
MILFSYIIILEVIVMTKTLLLKITTVLGIIPAIIGAFYVVPLWIGDALLEIGYKQFYLL